MSGIDWCKYIADIEADPTAITPRITIGQFIAMGAHIDECAECAARCERVTQKYPGPQGPIVGMN